MDWELFVLNVFVFFEFVFFKKINDRVAAALEKAIWRGKTFKPYLGAGWRHALAVFLGILAGIPVLFTKGLAWGLIAMALVSFVLYVGCRMAESAYRYHVERKAPKTVRTVKMRVNDIKPAPRPVKINALGFLEEDDSEESKEDEAPKAAEESSDATLEEAFSRGRKESSGEFRAWRCQCGRMQPGNVSMCVCGLFRPVQEHSFHLLKPSKPKAPPKEQPEKQKDGKTRWEQIQAERAKELAAQIGTAEEPPTDEATGEAILEEELSAVKNSQTPQGLQEKQRG